jgi:LCP family protein required for cell wall assembly
MLNTIPGSKPLRLGLLVSAILLISIVFVGSFLIANRFAGGSGGFVSFIPIKGLNMEDGNQENPLSAIEENESQPGWEAASEVVLTSWDGTNRVTVLIMGLDYRDWSSGEGPSRTDTMMLLTLDPLNNTAGILSIPRDLWVSIPGFDNGRINTAYFLGETYQTPGGGAGMAVKTVEQLLGITINYYAQVDFGAFIRFIDELGGVKLDVPERIRIDPINGNPKFLNPGRQTLTGELALAYARARNTKGGDLDRALRQQQVVFGIRDRLLNPQTLSDLIAKSPQLYAEISRGIQTNLNLDEVIKLAYLAQKVPEENIARRAISAADVLFAQSPDEQSILVPLPEQIRQLRDDVFLTTTGTLGPLMPGTEQERMIAEAARVVVSNGSTVEGLAARTRDFLLEKGVNVIDISNSEPTPNTIIIDFTGNPHTVRYLAELFGVLPGNYLIEYDLNSPVDVQIKVGVDWANSGMLP